MPKKTLTLVGDAKSAESELVKLQKQVDNLNNKLSQVSQKSRRTAKVAGDSFGKDMVASVGSAVAGLFSVQTAIGTVNQMLKRNQEIARESAQKQRASAGGLASLAQLAFKAPDPSARLDQLTSEASSIFQQGAGGSLGEAANLLFALESAGISGRDRQLVVDLKSSGVLPDASALASSAKGFLSGFGTSEAGTIRQIISKSLAASVSSPVGAATLLQSVTKSGAAAAAAQLGITDEAALAAQTVLAEPFGSDVAGTRLKRLFSKLALDDDFRGQPLEQTLSQISSKNLAPKQLKDLLGSTEAAGAFSLLTQPENFDKFRQIQEDVRRANTQDLGALAAGLPSTNREIGAALLSQQSSARLERSRADRGTISNLADVASDVLIQRAERENGSSFFAEMIINANRFAGGDEGFLRSPQMQTIGREDPDLLRQIHQTLNEIKEESRKTRQEFKRRQVNRNAHSE